MRKSSKGGDGGLAKLVGGTLGMILGMLFLWYFFSYGLAALFGTL